MAEGDYGVVTQSASYAKFLMFMKVLLIFAALVALMVMFYHFYLKYKRVSFHTHEIPLLSNVLKHEDLKEYCTP